MTYAPEVTKIPAGWTWADYQAFVAWTTSYYQPRLLASTGDWNETQRQLGGIIQSSEVADYWKRFVKSAPPSERDLYGVLTPEEAKRRFADMMERNVASGLWTEAQAASQAGQFATSVAEHGITYETPFYGSLEQQVATLTGAAERADPFRFGRAPTPEGGERGLTEDEYRQMIGGVGGAPFLGTTTGPLGFGATRRPGELPTGAREAARAARGVGEIPSAMLPFYEAIEGLQSHAMQQFFKSQFPYLFEKFGGAEARQPWWGAKQKQAAELARLGAKRRSQQWVLGKKGEYLRGMGAAPPSANPYLAAYLATEAKITGYRKRETKLKAAPKQRDPWATFLGQYPFMEKFITTPPAQRGFYPSRFAPFTRWL